MIALVLAGFAALAMGTYRPSLWLFGRLLPVRTRRLSRAAGFALLGGSLGWVLTGPDPTRDLVDWFGMLTLGALIVVGTVWALVGRRD